MNTKLIALDNLTIDEKNYIKYTLIHSGNNKSQVNGIMKYLDYSINSLEDAEQLLNKAPVAMRSRRYRLRPNTIDKWKHPFVSPSNVHEPYSQCAICKELFKTHTKNINGKKSHSLQKVKKENVKAVNEKKRRNSQEYKEMTRAKITKYIKICKICLEENKIYYTKLKCKHEFCNECLTKYFDEEIQKANVPVKCPESTCFYLIDEDEIKRKVSKENFNKYRRFIRRKEIDKIPNAVQCPFPDCESYAIKPINTDNNSNDILLEVNDLNQSKTEMMIQTDKKQEQAVVLRCIENEHEFCSSCLLKPHPGMPCSTFIENNFAEWKKDNTVRKCPKCGIEIIKQDGCNHMTCSKCKYQFCWICGGKYSSNHYSNPISPCYSKQFSAVKKSDNYETKLCDCSGILILLLKVLGCIILGVIGLAILLCIPGLLTMAFVFFVLNPPCSDDDDMYAIPEDAECGFFFTCLALGIALTSCCYFFIGIALTALICLSPVLIVGAITAVIIDE